MEHRTNRLTALCFGLLLTGPLFIWGGQDPAKSPPSKQDEPVKILATEVLVDVIVTDRKNRMVTDLTANDFEIYEDGARQTISSARLVNLSAEPTEGAGKEARPSEAPAPPSRELLTPRRPVNLIVLVFDNLSLARDSQVHARRAAHQYIDSMAPNDRVAVFGLDTRLFLVEPFSNDSKALKKAVEQATQGTSRQFTSSAEAVERLLQNPTTSTLTSGRQDISRLAAADAFADNPGAIEDPFAAMDAMLLNTFRSFETFETEIQARSTVLGLLALIQGQQILPGRKTVILFSEGFSMPSDLSGQFRSVIGSANRANVAIYTIDAGGLRLESTGSRVSRELSAIAESRARGNDPTRVEGGQTMLGRAEQLGRMDTQSVLTELAESTGGLAIHNTNDLRSGLERIDEDMRTYYVLSYAPANQSFDGRFRNIQVKSTRPDLVIRARTGYFALRTADASPVFEFEQPLFDLLYAPTPPNDFPLSLGAMHFPTPTPAVRIPIVAAIPANIITLSEEVVEKKKKDDQETHLVGELGVLALIKDARGSVGRKVSQNYQIRIPANELDSFKTSNLIFYRAVDLPAGNYQVDIVARDAKSGRAGVTRIPLIMPATQPAELRISSIVPTNRAESVTAEEYDATNPFHYEKMLIMPNLARTFSRSAQEMMFYFTVQTKAGSSVSAKVEFLQAGQVVAQAPGALPAPDENGRIQFIASFPVAAFPVGSYAVRVTVTDGTRTVSEQGSFNVIN